MHDARDAEDTRLLEAGEVGPLLEGYLGVILDRCRAKVRNYDDALDVAQNVYERLLAELKRGRRYRVPFRVVVHQVTRWKIQEHFQAKRYEEGIESSLYRLSTESEDPIDAWGGFEAMLEGLTELEAEVIELHYGVADLGFKAIAERLGKESNAVHQIHFRALEKLRGSAL